MFGKYHSFKIRLNVKYASPPFPSVQPCHAMYLLSSQCPAYMRIYYCHSKVNSLTSVLNDITNHMCADGMLLATFIVSNVWTRK
jgi:hypothetical protein